MEENNDSMRTIFNLKDTINKQMFGMCCTKDIDTFSCMYNLAQKNIETLAQMIYDKHFNITMEEEDEN